MKKILFVMMAAVLLVCTACNNNGGSNVSVTEQQKPRLLVLPSDQLLQKFGMLSNEDAQGKTIYIRNYAGYLLKDEDSKFIFSTIQGAFINYGYPLNDLEQTLKSLNDQAMVDEVDGIQKDAKTMLLTSAKPDIILELDYGLANAGNSRNINKSLTYTLRAIDAFSNKVVATIQQTGFGADSRDNTPAGLMQAALDKDAKEFTKQIDNYFEDIIANGRDITVRIAVDGASPIKLSDDNISGDTYTDFIIDYMKTHTLQGAYNMNRNTDVELYFTNVRIKTLNDDGTQYSAYDFARELTKALNQECGVKSKNTTQGLGDATIIVKNM